MMFGKVKLENINTYLSKVERYFPELTSNTPISLGDIENYYEKSFWGYKLFHSWAGAVHMALSRDGKFRKNDYFQQSDEVGDVIERIDRDGTLKVYEVGCGKGYNLRSLGRRFPSLSFVGLDLSAKHIKTARRELSALKNVEFHIGDFHAPPIGLAQEMDLVFAVETLCHATDLDAALSSISKSMRVGGYFIVFDGFRSAESSQLGESIGKAMDYAEAAMAVPVFHRINEFAAAAERHGFECELIEDRSDQAMPNLIRLSDLAKAYFKSDLFARSVLKVVPRSLVANSVAGLLMAVTVKSGAHRYGKLVLRKR